MHASTRLYVSSPAVACDYDRYFAGQGLFDYDSELLNRWFVQPGRLIDLGCGTGRHVVQFAQRRFDVVGVDLSDAMLAMTERKLERRQLTATLVKADICNLPTAPPRQSLLDLTRIGTADLLRCADYDYAICMFSTLGLICGRENRLNFLRTVRHLLKPHGQFALHVHNLGHNLLRHEGRVFLLTNLLNTLLGRAEPGDKILSHYRGIKDMYIHVFTRSQIVSLMEQAGFRIIDLIALNRRRTAELPGRFLQSVRANGFIIRSEPT